jgi:single-stranded-DNA-specific exonuclease
MLYSYLTALGGEADWYIPTRDEGYGLNAAAVSKIADDGTKLLITVDNGISAIPESALIAEKGMKLIITDHHTVPAELPTAAAILNPKQSDCNYPFKELAGCGVVLKLITALEDCDALSAIEQYGDLAAIGTIADIVSISGENRSIVSHGLQNIVYSENVGLHCLMKSAGLEISADEPLDSVTTAFTICPRINAAGRIATAETAVELLLCESNELAFSKADELKSLNLKRGEEEKQILSDTDKYLAANPAILHQRLLILSNPPGDNWHHGVIGIIASRLVNKFGKPCVIITTEEGVAKAEEEQLKGQALPARELLDRDVAKGSARGVGDFSVIAALTYCADLLIKFGGHAGAGGFSLKTSDIPAFKQKLLEFAAQQERIPVAEISADSCPKADSLTLENIEKLQILQPFGEGNPVPVFCLPKCRIKHKRPLKEGRYISFTVEYGGKEFKVLDFARCYVDFWYKIGDIVDLMVNIDINEYNGTRSPSIKVVDMRLSGLAGAVQDKFFVAKDTYEKLKRGEPIDPKLYSRIIPCNDDMKSAYNLIRESFCIDEVVQRSLSAKSGLNYCMLRVIIDVFAEAGLIEFNPVTGDIKTVKTGAKADLSKSTILIELRGRATS